MPRLVHSKPGETQDTPLSLSSDDEGGIEVEVKVKLKPLRRLRRGAASQESSRPDECHNCDDDDDDEEEEEEEQQEGSDLDDFVVPDDADLEYSGASESEEEEELEARKRPKKQRSGKKPKTKQKEKHPEYPTQTADDIERTILEKYSKIISFKRFQHQGHMYNVVYRVADSLPQLPHGHYVRILVPILEDVLKRNAVEELEFPFFTGLQCTSIMSYGACESGFTFDYTTGKKTSYFGCICTQAPNKGKIDTLYGVRDKYSGVYFMIGGVCLGHILGMGKHGLSVLPNEIVDRPGFITDLVNAIKRGAGSGRQPGGWPKPKCWPKPNEHPLRSRCIDKKTV